MEVAYTALNRSFPGYVNFKREADGGVRVTVRSDPSVIAGVRVCGRDCHPGDALCNNYCNRVKGRPMAARPADTEHVRDGALASFAIPADEWAKLVGRFDELG